MDTDIHNLFINLLGGILVAVFDRLFIYLMIKFKGFRYKQIFGTDTQNFYIVYGKMILKPKYYSQDRYPFLKPETNGEFNMSNPVSFAETKAAKYLSESYSKFLKKSPKLISDDEIKDKIDISYCSLGGFNNYKTIEVIESVQNIFFEFKSDFIVNKKDRQKIYKVDGVNDYAVIIKFNDRLFPNRTHLCVAGLGEWGTSGGSWFLANKWKELRKKVRNKNFGAIIKVKGGSDESAELVDIVF